MEHISRSLDKRNPLSKDEYDSNCLHRLNSLTIVGESVMKNNVHSQSMPCPEINENDIVTHLHDKHIPSSNNIQTLGEKSSSPRNNTSITSPISFGHSYVISKNSETENECVAMEKSKTPNIDKHTSSDKLPIILKSRKSALKTLNEEPKNIIASKKKVLFSDNEIMRGSLQCSGNSSMSDNNVNLHRNSKNAELEKYYKKLKEETQILKKYYTSTIKELSESESSQYSFEQWNTQKKEELKSYLESSKKQRVVIDKACGCVNGFSAHTFKNLMQSNQDKLCISINLKLESQTKAKPHVNFFAIYDGNGHAKQAQVLQDDLNKAIISNPSLLTEPEKSILKAFDQIKEKVNKEITECTTTKSELLEASSSVIVTINNKIHFANAGRSRGIISSQMGLQVNSLANSQKSCNEALKRGSNDTSPWVISFESKSDLDFILIGSDGLVDVLSNREIAYVVFSAVKESIMQEQTFNQMLEKVLVNVMCGAINKESKDNISCVFLCFENLYKAFSEKNLSKLNNCIERLKESTLEFQSIFEPIASALASAPAHNVLNENIALKKNKSTSKSSLMNIRKSTGLTECIDRNDSKINIHTKPRTKCSSFCCGIFS